MVGTTTATTTATVTALLNTAHFSRCAPDYAYLSRVVAAFGRKAAGTAGERRPARHPSVN
jgi:hypothetical protein